MQLFEAACVRNLLIVKNLEYKKKINQEWYHVKEERLFYRFLTFWKLCHIYFDHTEPCTKPLQQISKIKKVADFFLDGVVVSGRTAVECKENSTM